MSNQTTINYKKLPTGKAQQIEVSSEEKRLVEYCEAMLDVHYDREALLSCINYCKSQVKNSHIPLLADETAVGYDSAIYYDYQVATLERLFATVNKL